MGVVSVPLRQWNVQWFEGGVCGVRVFKRMDFPFAKSNSKVTRQGDMLSS